MVIELRAVKAVKVHLPKCGSAIGFFLLKGYLSLNTCFIGCQLIVGVLFVLLYSFYFAV